jgi:FdhE protein
MNTPNWDKRIQRAGELADEYQFAAEVLRFYQEVARFQKKVFEKAASHTSKERKPLREQIDLALPVETLPALLKVVEKHGPSRLVEASASLREQGRDQWPEIFAACIRGTTGNGHNGADPAQFFARACLQPYAEYLAEHSGVQLAGYSGQLCPLCDGKPQLGVLRPEGHGARRSLLCSFCLLEWEFRRVVCPACGEEEFDKLPRYSAEDFPHLKVEACDTCKTYIKTVDLSTNGLAVPLVDEIAAAPLDLWAREHGYSKVELNLMGL